MTKSRTDFLTEIKAALSGLVSAGSVVMICLPMAEAEPVAELVGALGARALSLGWGLSYGELKAAMDEARPDIYVGRPTRLLSMLRACGKGSLSRAVVCGAACPDTVINEIEDILCTPLRTCFAPEGCEQEDMARLDKQLFTLGALVDYRITALPGGYKLDGLYTGWIDARQICDVCPEVVAVRLREVTMDDKPLYEGERIVELK